ncbi:MAG: DUF3857 domain-containing protein [Cytophagales bacterium]|nr:DUF3857 domain-containing protein [Cytophagales bacterium]
MLKTVKKLSFVLIIFFIHSAHAQKPVKYGKVTKEDLLLEKCSIDPDANAMILGKSGILRFRYNNDKGWQYSLEVVVRKKIFNEEGKNEGNISISLYDPIRGGNREEISTLRASTYNLVGGKVERIKASTKDEQKTRLNDYRTEVSMALPNVKNGSVVEYTYTLVSDYIYNLTSWKFQEDIPVAYNFLDFTIPQYFNYQISQLGNVVDLDYTEEPIAETFTYQWRSEPKAGGGYDKGTSSLSSNSVRRKAIARDVRAFEDEPLMSNPIDRPSRIEFQLSTIQMPNRPIKNIAQDYTQFSTEILDWSNFGDKLDSKGIAKDQVASVEGSTDIEKAKTLYNWLSKNTTWNQIYGITGSDAGREVVRKKVGSVGDINLTLVALLRAAGLRAYPVILSTRGHGAVHPVYPSLQDFNYVIVSSTIDGKEYLLDATAGLPFGTIPSRCFNGEGWRLSVNGGTWVTLKNGNHSTSVSSTITFDEETINTAMTVKYGGHAGINFVKEARESGEESVDKLFSEALEEGTLENFQWTDSLGVEKPVVTFDWMRDNEDPDIIYLNPLPYAAVSEVPFKREERFSNIDYRYKTSVTALSKIHLPEGYSVELPEPIRMILPNKGASFTYSVNNMSGVVTILSRFQLNKLEYTPEEYKELKNFYEAMAEKNAQTLILKKT